MRKWLGMALAGLVALACVATAQAETKYAVCVGINKYKEISSLSGCVNDANYFYTNLVTRGGWQKSNMTLLKDSGATKAAIRRAVSNCAAKAVSGDVFVYQQSSHGGQESGTDTYLCVYDEDYYDNSTAYNDYEIAADMASFAAGVKVVVIVDACHSGGLFKDAARAKVPFDLAGRVTAIMNADRAARLARGERGIEKKLSASEIGWVTAANYNESSLDGGYYDSNRWMSNSSEEGNVMGGVFLGAFTWGWWDGSADTRSGYGDNDGYADPYECWRAGYVICTNKNLQGSDAFTPQCTNVTVLRSVELGWVGDEEPSGVRFASIPAQTATVGQALNYTVLATNSDGSTGAIKYSVTSSTAPSGSYSVNATSGAFTFTPATDGTFTFDFVGTNSTAHTFGKATMSVTATLAAPAKLSNSGNTDNSFTANWGAVAGAASYILEVYAVDAATASKAADSAFELVTSDDGLTEGEYVILGENADNAMNNTCSGDSSGNMGCTEVTVSGSTVSAEDATIIWTLAGDASSCTLFNAAAGKFVNPATARSCGWSDTASGSWTLSASDGVVSAANSASSKWKLQYNSSSPRFAMYESTQKNLRFFRRDGGSGAVFSGDVGNVTSFTVTDLIPGDYTWRVRAVGNAKGPFSDVQEVSLVSDPTAPPSIRPIDDIEIIVGETATATVVVSTPEEAPVTSLSITAGDAAAKLGEDGVFTFAPAAPGEYSFTITAVNANDSASVSFSVTAILAAPVAAEATAVGATGFTANWAAVEGAQSYLLTVVEGAAAPSGEAVTDTLTADGFHLASTYGDGSYVSEASGAEYEAYAMKKSGGTAIQLNSKNGIGIVTTVSAGNVTEVRVSFDSATKSGNTLNVYGSADAYSASSDLYSDSTAGTLLGTIVYDGSTAEGSFAIPASCPFVGLRSASGAIYLDFVEVEWNGSAKAARAQGDVILDAVDVGNVTSHDVTGLSMLTQYSYTVAAKAGDVVSEDSEAISVTTLDAEVAPAWSAIPEQSATLGEPFVLDFSSYLVAKPAATVTASAGSVDGSVLTFTPDAAGPTTVTLTAVNTMGSATATVVIVAVPAAPEVVEPTSVSSNSFVATWVAVDGADSYHLVVVEAAAASGTARAAGDIVFEGDVTGTSREITGLAPETAYSYTVAAIVDGVTGPASEPVAVTTKAGPAAPSWSAIPAQSTYAGATFQLDLSAFLAGNPEPTVTADVGTVTGLYYVYEPETAGAVTVTLTAANESGTAQTTFVLSVAEAPTGGTHYAVVVGCNQYDTNYVPANNFLEGCVPDANHVYGLITTRGKWEAANVTKLTDASAKWASIRAAVSNAASKAVAGDTFLYFHSSHGGNYTYTFVTNKALYTDWPIMVYSVDPEGIDNCICSYEQDYTAADLAADLAAFDPAVNIVVMVDACHSAGLFKYDTSPTSSRVVRRNAAGAAMRSAHPSVFAGAVRERLGAIRRARGIRAAASNVGFVTAADFDEYSYDSQGGDGGEFTTAFIEGVTNGACDGAEYGDQDGWATFYEGWNYAKDIAVGMPEGTEVDYGVYVDANGYALYDNRDYSEYYGEPDYYYDYYFTHAQITNEAVLRAVRVGYAGNPTLDAPVAAPAADVTDSSFTASWSAVADATGYRVQVATDPSFSTGGAADTLTVDDLAATGTSYTDFSDIAKDSGAVYAGRSAKSTSGAIQLNSSQSAGIWTTASGGNVSRVAVKWNDATTTSKPRSLQIYGSDTALDSYSAVSGATSLGTIVYGTGTELAISGSYAYVGILPVGGALYLDSVTVEWGTAGSGSSIVLDDNVGNVTACDVSGLEPETDYWYRVQALGDPVDSDFSNVIGLTTDASAPYAPVWEEIPPQTAAAGAALVVDLKPYVTGSPKPTITADAGTVEDGVLTVSFADAGDYTVNLTAENSEGSDTATLAVTVTDAPVTVPVLTLSNATDSTFDADWTACTGAETYQFQVATDDQFTPGGGGGGDAVTETFANAVFSTTTSSYTNQTIEGGDLGTWTATSCRGDSTSPIIRYAGTLTSPSLAGGVAAVEFDYEWPYKESGTCDIDLYVNGTKVGSATVTGGEAGTASYNGFTAVSGPATIEFLNTGTSNKRMQITQVRITSASRTAAKDGGSLLLDTTTNGISLTVTGLEPDTTYYARVRMAEGEWSAVESITTTGEGPAGPAKYALCVGLSEYDMAAFEALGLEVTPLKGCVNDATYLKKNLSERGGWAEADIALLTNGAATKAAIRGAIAAAAAKAKAGDTFVYEHSSHGLQGDEFDDYTAALATYENLYTDTELAEDLAAFADGVKVVVLIDACHSAGMIDDDDDDSDGGAGSASKARPAAAFDIARRVSALIDANRAVRKARGEDVSRTLTSDQIGWVTAAAYDETSKDGGYYDTDAWMSDDDAEGEERGGLFLASITWGWWSGKADVTGEGDGDGWFDAYEGWSFSTPFCAELDQTPQYLHEDVLRSVELGWVGDTAPSEAILFDPVPGVSVGIGEEAVLDGIVARNPDGTTDGITLSIVDPSPEEADYAFADGKLTFTPDEDGLFLFTVRAVKGRTSASKILGVTAILPAPVAQEVADADIAEDGFTARWLGVDAARNYQLQVSTDPDFSMGEPDELVNEGFDDVTNKVASLPDDWTFSGTFGIYATGGEAPPSIKLSTDGATLTTPPFKLTSAENGLAFWTKGNPSGTDMTSTLTVQQLVGEEWQTLKDGTFVPSTDGETKEFESLDKAATRIRFVMAKTAGNIAIDDVVVAQSQGGVEVDEDEIPASETSYAVEDLEPGTTYYFRVRALANSRSAWSETIEVTTAGEKPIPVPDLTALISETDPATSLVAFWLCTGVSEFRLQVATDEGFVSPVYDEELSESTQTVTGLTPETTYYVRVCGLVGERVGDWSNVESVTTAAGGKPDEIPIDETTFPTIGFKGGFSGSADTVFASGYSDVEAIYATWNGTEWQWVTDDETGELIVLPNEAPEGWPTVQIAYPEGVNGALLRLRFIPKGD